MTSKSNVKFAAFGLNILCMTAWADDHRAQVLNLVSTCTAINNFVDVGPIGPSTGDIYIFVDELFTAVGSRKVGEVNGRCNIINPAVGSLGCTYVSIFDDGTITMEGILNNMSSVESVFSVTGGTGRYRGASGEGSVNMGSPCGPHRVTVTFNR